MDKKNGKLMVGQTKPDRAVGFCHSRAHQGYLSEKQLKAHGCLCKQCPKLQKYESHKFWIRRAEIKAAKKLAKQEARLCMA